MTSAYVGYTAICAGCGDSCSHVHMLSCLCEWYYNPGACHSCLVNKERSVLYANVMPNVPWLTKARMSHLRERHHCCQTLRCRISCKLKYSSREAFCQWCCSLGIHDFLVSVTSGKIALHQHTKQNAVLQEIRKTIGTAYIWKNTLVQHYFRQYKHSFLMFMPHSKVNYTLLCGCPNSYKVSQYACIASHRNTDKLFSIPPIGEFLTYCMLPELIDKSGYTVNFWTDCTDELFIQGSA